MGALIAVVIVVCALVLGALLPKLRTDLIELDTTIEKLAPERTGRKGRGA